MAGGWPGHRVAGIATTGPSVAAGSAANAVSAASADGTDRLRCRKLQRQRTYRTVNDCFNVALELSPMYTSIRPGSTTKWPLLS